MTHKEIINKAGEFCTDFRELADELKMFSYSVGEYSNDLPLYWRENIRYIEQDVENIANYLRRAKDRLSFDMSQIRD